MCLNNKCTKKEECYRYQAVPNMIQYYDKFNFVKEYETCPFFIDIKQKKTRAIYKDGSEETPEPSN